MTKDEALKQALEAYLCREMPAGTVIGDPKWWAPKIANVIKEVLAQPAQEPLSDDSILDIADYYLYNGGKTYGVLEFARAIEAAQGIKGNT